MGLSTVLARAASRRAHVLLVETPGHLRTRCALEREVRARGWSLALSPADADLLAVCGDPGPRLADAIDLVWEQVPGPRVRLDALVHDDLALRLDAAHATLLDTAHHRDDAAGRPVRAALEEADDDMDHGDMDDGDMDDGDMGMSPGGLPLAGGGDDRDGLEMDVLNVRLGPVLPYWPAGLVLRCSLHGDAIAAAEAEQLDAELRRDVQDPVPPAVRTLDNVVSLLALAGWEDAATQARHVRDARLRRGDRVAADERLERLRLKVTRSRVLRWSLRGIRPLDAADLERLGLPAHLGGDVHDRLLTMFDRAGDDRRGDQEAARLPVESCAGVVEGLDVATARLTLASLDLHALPSGHAHEKAAAHA